MHAFLESPKRTQQSRLAKPTISARAHFGHSPDVNSILHPQRTKGNQAVERLMVTNAGMARFGHDFGRIPVHSNPAISSPPRQRVEPESDIGETIHAFGVIAAKTSLRPHYDVPATDRRRAADIYAQGESPIRVGGQLAAWDTKPLGAAETGAHLREIQRRFGPEGVKKSVRGLADARGEGFAHSAAERAGLSAAGRSLAGGAIGQQAADA